MPGRSRYEVQVRGLREVKTSDQVESLISGPRLGLIQTKTYGQKQRKRGVCRALADLKATVPPRLC